MTEISTATTVAELVVDRPSRARLFEQLGLDYCCGGRQPLGEACTNRGLNPDAVLALLGGGCHAPIGAFATIDAERTTIVAGRVEPDGSERRVGTWTGPAGTGASLAAAAAEGLL